MAKSPLDTAEQAVFVVGGVAALFLGYKLYQVVVGVEATRQPRKNPWDYVDPNAPPVPGQASECGHEGEPSCQPTPCHAETSWLGLKSTTECDAPVEPDWVKAKGRSARILWAVDNGNEHVALDALRMPGSDAEAEPKAVYFAGKAWRADPGTDFYRRNEDAGKILLWWGSRSRDAQIKAAADANDIAMLQKYATGEF